jgi:peptide-methionine (S)-S-oxide reductase
MKANSILFGLWATLIFSFSCTGSDSHSKHPTSDKTPFNSSKMEMITLGAGCFWCVETIFQNLKGVEKVVSGYSGGSVKNPSYKEVCMGTTGHAEVVQLTYNPAVVSLEEILEAFFLTHDPTTLNRQGNDVGTQYRSAIFFHNPAQKVIADSVIARLNASGAWDKPIVTQVQAFDTFYPAEDYHQNYYNQNSGQPYCQYVIRPKLDKFRKVFKEKLK